jgi:hypothetical protein
MIYVNHLEQLISECLGFKGHFIRRNVTAGKLPTGGSAGEIEPFAYGLGATGSFILNLHGFLNHGRKGKKSKIIQNG